MRALRPMSQEPEQNIFLKAKLDMSHHMMLYPRVSTREQLLTLPYTFSDGALQLIRTVQNLRQQRICTGERSVTLVDLVAVARTLWRHLLHLLSDMPIGPAPATIASWVLVVCGCASATSENRRRREAAVRQRLIRESGSDVEAAPLRSMAKVCIC